MSDQTNVLLIQQPQPGRLQQVLDVAPAMLRVSEITAAELGEDSGVWPAHRAGSVSTQRTPDECEQLLRDAHVILLGLPYPKVLYPRATNVRWIHHPNAGASNIRGSDIWGAPIPVTTSRGSNAAIPIAESVVAAALAFARGIDHAVRSETDRRAYAGMVAFGGKTMGIVGLGGIGSEVARLSRGLGMRVVATRWSATHRQADTDGVDELFPPAELHSMLAQSDFVAVCTMLTDRTRDLIDARAFAAMKPNAVLINIARGEVVDEAALRDALDAVRLLGVYTDVYAGEHLGQPPPAWMLEHPRVAFTPHISGHADTRGRVGFDLFLENLRRFLDGQPLVNVIDWERGY
jgi:phosphoglycerate dehydrogenase-like enzyme